MILKFWVLHLLVAPIFAIVTTNWILIRRWSLCSGKHTSIHSGLLEALNSSLKKSFVDQFFLLLLHFTELSSSLLGKCLCVFEDASVSLYLCSLSFISFYKAKVFSHHFHTESIYIIMHLIVCFALFSFLPLWEPMLRIGLSNTLPLFFSLHVFFIISSSLSTF